MRYVCLFFFLQSTLSLSAQDLMHSSLYHLETLDCPENMICESRTDGRRKLIFFQIFDTDGRLHSEYLRTSDSTFLYKSFHLMDHFTLIKKPSYYGQKVGGNLLISDKQVGGIKEAWEYDTYEAYKYHDTLLMPIGGWSIRDSYGQLLERLNFDMQGKKEGIWDSYRGWDKKIVRTYKNDSLVNTEYVDEMSKRPEAREILNRLEGTWYVYAQWKNNHMAHVAIGQREPSAKWNYSIYVIKNELLKIQTFKEGKRVGRNEKYQLTIKNSEWLVFNNKNQSAELKVLYLSDDDFHLLQKN